MTRAPGSGSRARSREIGYAEGVWEMGRVLEEFRKGVEMVAQCEDTPAIERLEFLAMARAYKHIERYAFQVWQLHTNERGDFASSVEHLAYLERECGRPAPRRELPQHEQSENN